jgi:predicted  nucleic acid-binding Zn-ribbon protein
MIAMAQRFIEEAQSEAEEKAREFTAAAQERAREIVNEARSRAEDEVNRLNGLKQRLSEDVETLSHQLQAERARIAQVLAEFTMWVETSLQAGAKSSSVATRRVAHHAAVTDSARSAAPGAGRGVAPVPTMSRPPLRRLAPTRVRRQSRNQRSVKF